MLPWVLLSLAVGAGLGFALGPGGARMARRASAVVLVLSLAPLAMLWIRDHVAPPPGETNDGILAVMIAMLLIPCALGIFVASFFND